MNKKILEKIEELPSSEKKSASLIIELLQFEEKNMGWYKDTYNKLVAKHCPEDIKYED